MRTRITGVVDLSSSLRWACFYRVAAAILLLGSMGVYASAQNVQFTQGSIGSGLDKTLDIPLQTYPGRGAASVSVTLHYSSRVWRIGTLNTIVNNQFSAFQTITEAIYAENSVSGWRTSLNLPIIEWPRNDDTYYFSGKPFCHACQSNARQFRVARVYIILPDGAKHELRKSDQPYEGAITMQGTFYAIDGSRLRYDSTGQNTGTLYFPDGSHYKLNGSTAQFIDRNGNTLNYDHATREWTDTLGRVITIPFPVAPAPGEQLYNLPGLSLPYKFIWKRLSESGVLTPLPGGVIPNRKPIANEYLPNPNQLPTAPNGNNFPITLQTNYTEQPSLFISAFLEDQETGPQTLVVGRGQIEGALFDPVVLTEIVLPNNLKYKFSYNIYGEIDKVVYPTGAFERYEYGQTFAISDVKTPYNKANRGVKLRQISANGSGNDFANWTYEALGGKVTTTAPDGGRTEAYRTKIATPEHQGTQGSISTYWPFGFESALQGQIYEHRTYAPVSQGGAMLQRNLREFEQTVNTVEPSIPLLDNTQKSAFRNARLKKEVSLILDTGGDALAQTTNYEYEANGHHLTTGLDLTATVESRFAPVAQSIAIADPITAMPAGTFASRFETIYLDDAAYRDRNILGLATDVFLKGIVNGTLQTVSQSKSFYDEYELQEYQDLTGNDFTDPGAARGNVTTSRRYVVPAVTPNPGIFLETHTHYDQCGNALNSTDARGIQSHTEYSPAFKYAYITKTITAIPDPSGAHGSNTAFETSSTFDYTTGLPLTTKDINGQITSFSYKNDQNVSDPLNRLRKVTRPDGSWTKYTFNDVVGDIFTLTETSQDATRTLKAYQYFDALGRASRGFIAEGENSYIATDAIYDPMGRVWKSSNPYRTTTRDGVSDVSHTSQWTETIYDSSGRVVTMTLADASVVQTSYQGVYMTVTDPAGKQRRQKSDEFGRLVRVDEPNPSGSLGTVDAPAQATTYDYDTQGNVVHIAQGASPVQHRYFKYDGLGRLTYEHHVEQDGFFTASDPVTNHSNWSRKLVYDETIDTVTYSGLLTSVYDARNVKTEFRYDNLNRVYQISYSDTTPTVTNKYDQAREDYFNNGFLTEALTAAVNPIPATAQLYNFDLMGRVAGNKQTVGTEPYSMSYAYNLGGVLTSETYPSGRVVNYEYDDVGRLSEVSSGAKTYASNFDYTLPSGLLKAVTLGNDAVESYDYNSRLQLKSLDLTRNGTQIQHYDYKFGVYDPATNNLDLSKNNGQIAQIDGLIGTQKQWSQRFAYDSLARLSSAREFQGNTNTQPSYIVKYDYDVFGNRMLKSAENTGNPFTPIWVEDNQVNHATNQFSAGVTYDQAGNVTTDSKFRNRKYQYDANNRQKQSSNLDDSGVVKNIFDAGGQRVATQVGGVITNVMVYDARGRIVAEYSTNAAPSGTQYVFSDHQGTPRVITNNEGGVIARNDYLPFGEDLLNNVGLRASTPGYGGSGAARQKYAAMEVNEATGMAHTLWRQYDAYSGRWTAADPYRGSMSADSPQSLNRYSYVENDPVNKVDPSGLMPFLPDASTSWSDVADGFWGSSAGGPRRFNHIAEAMARHDSIIETGYDPARGKYRGDVEVEYVPDSGGYSVSRTLSNPTPEELGQTMESMANDTSNLVAQKGPRRPSGGGGQRNNPRFDPKNYRIINAGRGRQTLRYVGPRPWREGLVTVGGQWAVGRDNRPTRPPGDYAKHHIFPQQSSLRPYFNAAGINIHETTVMIPVWLHQRLHRGAGGGEWNMRWERFFRQNPRANQTQIWNFAWQLTMQYNIPTHAVSVGPY